MKEKLPKLILAGAVALGTFAVANHEQERDNEVNLLKNSIENLRQENSELWGNVCRSQALTDLQTQGRTDISPDTDGMANCRKDSEQWITIFSNKPKQ